MLSGAAGRLHKLPNGNLTGFLVEIACIFAAGRSQKSFNFTKSIFSNKDRCLNILCFDVPSSHFMKLKDNYFFPVEVAHIVYTGLNWTLVFAHRLNNFAVYEF